MAIEGVGSRRRALPGHGAGTQRVTRSSGSPASRVSCGTACAAAGRPAGAALPAGGGDDDDVLGQLVAGDENVAWLVVQGLPGDVQLAVRVQATLVVQAVGLLVLWPCRLSLLQGLAPAPEAGLLPLGLGGGDDQRLSLGDAPAR